MPDKDEKIPMYKTHVHGVIGTGEPNITDYAVSQSSKQKLTHGNTFSGMLVNSDIKKQIEEGTASHFLKCRERGQGIYELIPTLPEEGSLTPEGPTFKIRENHNRLMKGIARKFIDSDGEIDAKAGSKFIDGFVNRFFNGVPDMNNINTEAPYSMDRDNNLNWACNELEIPQNEREDFKRFLKANLTATGALDPNILTNFKQYADKYETLENMKELRNKGYHTSVSDEELEQLETELQQTGRNFIELAEMDPKAVETVNITDCDYNRRVIIAYMDQAQNADKANKKEPRKNAPDPEQQMFFESFENGASLEENVRWDVHYAPVIGTIQQDGKTYHLTLENIANAPDHLAQKAPASAMSIGLYKDKQDFSESYNRGVRYPNEESALLAKHILEDQALYNNKLKPKNINPEKINADIIDGLKTLFSYHSNSKEIRKMRFNADKTNSLSEKAEQNRKFIPASHKTQYEDFIEAFNIIREKNKQLERTIAIQKNINSEPFREQDFSEDEIKTAEQCINSVNTRLKKDKELSDLELSVMTKAMEFVVDNTKQLILSESENAALNGVMHKHGIKDYSLVLFRENIIHKETIQNAQKAEQENDRILRNKRLSVEKRFHAAAMILACQSFLENYQQFPSKSDIQKKSMMKQYITSKASEIEQTEAFKKMVNDARNNPDNLMAMNRTELYEAFKKQGNPINNKSIFDVEEENEIKEENIIEPEIKNEIKEENIIEPEIKEENIIEPDNEPEIHIEKSSIPKISLEEYLYGENADLDMNFGENRDKIDIEPKPEVEEEVKDENEIDINNIENKAINIGNDNNIDNELKNENEKEKGNDNAFANTNMGTKLTLSYITTLRNLYDRDDAPMAFGDLVNDLDRIREITNQCYTQDAEGKFPVISNEMSEMKIHYTRAIKTADKIKKGNGSPYFKEVADSLIQGLRQDWVDVGKCLKEHIPLPNYMAKVHPERVQINNAEQPQANDNTLRLQMPSLSKVTTVGNPLSTRFAISYTEKDAEGKSEQKNGFFTKASYNTVNSNITNMFDTMIENDAYPQYRDELKLIKRFFTVTDDYNILQDVDVFDNKLRYDPPFEKMGINKNKVFHKENNQEVMDKDFQRMWEDVYSKVSKIRSSMKLSAQNLGLPHGERMDTKNVAMSEAAEILEVPDILAKSKKTEIMCNDKLTEGIFMEKADGYDPTEVRELNPHSPLAVLDAQKAEKAFDYPIGLKKMADLQVLDYLCGNVGRKETNLFVQIEDLDTDNPKLVGIRGIDNGSSFGTKTPQADEVLGVISKDMSEKINDPKFREKFKRIMQQNNITDAAVGAALSRLEKLRQKISEGKIKTVEDKDWGRGDFTLDKLSTHKLEYKNIFDMAMITRDRCVGANQARNNAMKDDPNWKPDKKKELDFTPAVKVEKFTKDSMDNENLRKLDEQVRKEYTRAMENKIRTVQPNEQDTPADYLKNFAKASRNIYERIDRADAGFWCSSEYRKVVKAAKQLKDVSESYDKKVRIKNGELTNDMIIRLNEKRKELIDKMRIYEEAKAHQFPNGGYSEVTSGKLALCEDVKTELKTTAFDHLKNALYLRDDKRKLSPDEFLWKGIKTTQELAQEASGDSLKKYAAQVLYYKCMQNSGLDLRDSDKMRHLLNADKRRNDVNEILNDRAFEQAIAGISDDNIRRLCQNPDELMDKFFHQKVLLQQEAEQQQPDPQHIQNNPNRGNPVMGG